MKRNRKDSNSTIGMDVLDAAQAFDGRQVAGMYNEAIVRCVADDGRYVSVLRTVLTWMRNRGRRSRMESIRDETENGIRSIIARHGGRDADLTALGFSPIISEDPLDGNSSFTLDRVRADWDRVTVDSSSCCDSDTRDIRDLDLDTLVAVLDFLEEHEDAIWEEEKESSGGVFVVHLQRNRDGVSESSVIGVYHDRESARKDFARERSIILGDIEASGLKPVCALDNEYDIFTDDDDEFEYYDFDNNHHFKITLRETEVQ